jgi:hypothetical protein
MESYPWSQYLEYPLLVLQNLLLLLLLGDLTSSLATSAAAVTAVTAAIGAVAGGALSRHVVLLAMVSSFSPSPLSYTSPPLHRPVLTVLYPECHHPGGSQLQAGPGTAQDLRSSAEH